jgi:hypothetical protein
MAMTIGHLGNGFIPQISPTVRGHMFSKNSPFIKYIRRKLPQPGQEADAYMDLQMPAFAFSGPTFANKRQLPAAEQTLLANQMIGPTSIGGYINISDYDTQSLVDSNQQQSSLASQFVG